MPAARKLTAISLPNLPEGDYPDPLLPGLTFRVRKRRRIWTIRHRVGGKQRRDTLGFYPKMGMADAREAARGIAERVEAGAPIATPPVHPRLSGLSLGGLIDRYEAMRRKEGVRIKHLDHAMKSVRDNLADYLALPVAQFSKADLKAARDVIFDRAPVMAVRFMSYLGPVMRWAAQEDLIPHNFHRDIRKGKERKRTRVLTDAELKAVWHASYTLGNGDGATNYGRLVRFLILTLQRFDEGASVTHGSIIDGQWRFLTKDDKPHRLRLSKKALAELGVGEANDLCFTGRLGGKIRGVSKLKAALDEASGVTEWRHHDLRRTGSSRLEETHDAALVHHILNHSRSGLSAVYLQGELIDKMAGALAHWASEVDRIVGGKSARSA